MSASSDAEALTGWVETVCRELGIEPLQAVDIDLVLRLTGQVAHGVSRPAAPVTAFLVGLAAAAADGGLAAARDAAERIGRLAGNWPV